MTVEHSSLLQRARRLADTGQAGAAIQAYQELLTRFPGDANSWFNLGVLLRRTGRYPAALSAYDQALAAGISVPEEVHLNKSVLLLEGLRDAKGCEQELEKALALKPDYIPALFNLGGLQEDLGKREAARQTYERLQALEPENAEFLARRAGLEKTSAPSQEIISALQTALERQGLSLTDQAQLGFALGRLLDGMGAYEDAFTAYRSANEAAQLSAPQFRYSAEQDRKRLDETISAFPAMTSLDVNVPASDPKPVFILGMFRSGSTLVEQVLAGHKDVVSGGELDLLSHITRALGGTPQAVASAPDAQIDAVRTQYQGIITKIAQGAAIVTDKRPENFWEIGLIKRMFPDAKIIHTRRHPLDNCLSVYFQNLHPSLSYAMDLEHCAEHLLVQRRMMTHWQSLWSDDILTLDYGDVVSQPDETISRMLAFLGLSWDANCLEFYTSDSIVRTASVWQVRQPLHAKSLGRWQHYEPYLQSVRTKLAASEFASEL